MRELKFGYLKFESSGRESSPDFTAMKTVCFTEDFEMARNSTFSIRSTACTAGSKDPYGTKAHDDIDRMVALIGNIPFDQYFTEPITTVGNLMLANLVSLPKKLDRLFPVRTTITERLTAVAASKVSFSDVLTAGSPGAKDLSIVLDSLEAYGIFLPRLSGEPAMDEKKAAALKKLLSIPQARALTYRKIFEVANCDVDKATSRAVINAVNLRVLPITRTECCWNLVTRRCEQKAGSRCNSAFSHSGVATYSLVSDVCPSRFPDCE